MSKRVLIRSCCNSFIIIHLLCSPSFLRKYLRKICFILPKGQLFLYFILSISYHCEKRCYNVNKIFNLPPAYNFKHRCHRSSQKGRVLPILSLLLLHHVSRCIWVLRLVCDSVSFNRID